MDSFLCVPSTFKEPAAIVVVLDNLFRVMLQMEQGGRELTAVNAGLPVEPCGKPKPICFP
jgi:hypothetical protein